MIDRLKEQLREAQRQCLPVVRDVPTDSSAQDMRNESLEAEVSGYKQQLRVYEEEAQVAANRIVDLMHQLSQVKEQTHRKYMHELSAHLREVHTLRQTLADSQRQFERVEYDDRPSYIFSVCTFVVSIRIDPDGIAEDYR